MKLDQATIAELAAHLETCELEARDTLKITDAHPDMDWEDAYAIQDEIKRRKIARGSTLVGYKAGLTSSAKMKQMGVSSPVFGFMTDDFLVPDGGEVEHARLIHPKVEPEIAFVLKHALKGPGCHVGQVLEATACLLPAIEVIDSRYRDFKFDLKSVIADNTSAVRFVLGGTPVAAQGQDLSTLGLIMEKNGQAVATGIGAAVLGNPANAVAALANHLGRQGLEIPAGAIVLSGGMTEAVAVAPGDTVSLRVHGMGRTSLHFN